MAGAAPAAGLSFGAAQHYPTGRGRVAVAVGDFNSDGAKDLVTANGDADTVSVLLGDGVGDFNGDGMQDLVTVFTEDFSGEAGVLLNDGAGGFPAMRTFPTYLEPVSVAVGDLSGDGKQDLVTVQRLEGSGAVGVLLGDGAGSFAFGTDVRTSRELFCVALGDFNGDGRQDVACVKQNVVIILRDDDLGGLSKETDFAVGTQSTDIAVGDFNGDGKQDLVTADYASNTASVLLNGARAASASAPRPRPGT